VQRLEGNIRIEFVDGVQRIVRVELVDWIEWVVRIVPVDRVRRIPGIDAVDGIEWILGVYRIDRVQRIVRTKFVDGIEDVVVALVLLGKAGFGKHRGDRDDQWQKQEEDNPHGNPPESGTASVLNLLPAWGRAQAVNLGEVVERVCHSIRKR